MSALPNMTDGEWLRRLWSGAETADEPEPATVEPTPEPERPRLGLAGKLAISGAAALIVAIVGAPATHHRPPPKRPAAVASTYVTTVPATTSAAAAGDPLPFKSVAICPPGASNDARGLATTVRPVPWVCVNHTAGQPLQITLTDSGGAEHAYVLTGLWIVPGDISPPGPDGDPWMAHRCVKKIGLQFNDVEHVPAIPLDTGCVHGKVYVAIPNVTASQITLVVRQTIRPPATGDNQGLLKDLAFPTLGTEHEAGSDPSDGTFAVGFIGPVGYEPTR